MMKLHLFASTLALLPLALPSTLAADKRPNIFFAFAGDRGRYATAYASVDGLGSANDVVKTPNFDRIAREGERDRRNGDASDCSRNGPMDHLASSGPGGSLRHGTRLCISWVRT